MKVHDSRTPGPPVDLADSSSRPLQKRLIRKERCCSPLEVHSKVIGSSSSGGFVRRGCCFCRFEERKSEEKIMELEEEGSVDVIARSW
ncbi:hypothetical protein R1flu_007383 [Riccia fluitans]|uniref:Uncharacterized protein n=1 Tax=Riccia fluitans TaxID=41844 RepID=A0ABD1Z1D4_9MARC